MYDLPAMLGPDAQMLYEFIIRAILVGTMLGIVFVFSYSTKD